MGPPCIYPPSISNLGTALDSELTARIASFHGSEMVNNHSMPARGRRILVKTMYIVNWNPDSNTVEANLAGYLTRGEAECFLEDLRETLAAHADDQFNALLDFAAVTRVDDDAKEVFDVARTAMKSHGACLLSVVARDEEEQTKFVESHLQEVLEGQERYFAYHLAA